MKPGPLHILFANPLHTAYARRIALGAIRYAAKHPGITLEIHDELTEMLAAGEALGTRTPDAVIGMFCSIVINSGTKSSAPFKKARSFRKVSRFAGSMVSISSSR